MAPTTRIKLIAVALSACLATMSALAQQSTAEATVRIGVFDSRAVAVAFQGSEMYREDLRRQSDAWTVADQAGQRRAVGRTRDSLDDVLRRLYEQEYGWRPVDDLLARLGPELSRIAERAGVSELISKWDDPALRRHGSAERVDVTAALVEAFSPIEGEVKWALAITALPVLPKSALTEAASRRRPYSTREPTDALRPMYGGAERERMPFQRVSDEWLIERATSEFGTRERAASAWIDQGFQFYETDQLARAMQRFNQAWLLNPRDPQVFWGFASVLHDRGENCRAQEMMERALETGPQTQGLLPDAGRIATLCAMSGRWSAEAKAARLTDARRLFELAETREPRKDYLYSVWATALYWEGRYEEAWEKVDLARRHGGDPGKRFLKLLKKARKPPRR